MARRKANTITGGKFLTALSKSTEAKCNIVMVARTAN